MTRVEFENLALQYYDDVNRMAMHLVRHPDEALDLVQETYLKALKVADGFEERGGGMRSWLFKILHNAFYTRFSKAKREPIAIEEFQGAAATSAGPGEPAPAWNLAALDWEQVDERLKDAIDRLRPEYRTVLLLWGVEEMKYGEIAEAEDVPIGTVMSRLHRARRILAGELLAFAGTKTSITNVLELESGCSADRANRQVWRGAA